MNENGKSLETPRERLQRRLSPENKLTLSENMSSTGEGVLPSDLGAGDGRRFGVCFCGDGPEQSDEPL